MKCLRHLPPIVVGIGMALTTAATSAAPVLPTQTDPRVVAWIDPNNALASYPKYRVNLQLGQDSAGKNIERDITTFPEPGYLDWKVNQFTMTRGADPANASKKAFRHKVIKGMSYRQDSGYKSARAGILSTWSKSSPSVLRYGVPYWAAYAVYVANDHPFDGSGDHIGIMSLGHSVSSSNTISMNMLHLRKDGKLRFWVQGNRVLDGTDKTRTGRVYDFPIKRGVWNYIVIQWKYEWDVAKKPYTRLWRAEGDGPAVQLVNTDIANAFNESAGYFPWKFSIYMWDINNGWGTSATRTTYTKGLYILRDQQGASTLDVNTMLALARSR